MLKSVELQKTDPENINAPGISLDMARKIFEIVNRANEGTTFCVKASEISGLRKQREYETEVGVVHDAVLKYLLESGIFTDEFIDAKGEISVAVSNNRQSAQDMKFVALGQAESALDTDLVK